MKLRLFFLFCLFSLSATSQITSLANLSKGAFQSYNVIKDANNNIKGYFMTFVTDKVAKETYEIEYVVLDENLKKVTNGFINEMKFEAFLLNESSNGISVSVDLYKNKLLICFSDSFSQHNAYYRYRILDITTNTLSDPFIFNKGKMLLNPVMDRKTRNYDENQSEKISFFEGVGLIVNNTKTDKKSGVDVKFLARYDNDFKETWRFVYDKMLDKKFEKQLRYLNSDTDVIAMFNHVSRNYYFTNQVSLLFIGAKDGKLRNEYAFPDIDQYAYNVVDCKITDDRIYVMGNYSDGGQSGRISDTKNYGLYTFTFDKKTGKLLDKKFLLWEAWSALLPINKKGYVKKEGCLFPHNMLLKNDGSMVVVCETFEQLPVLTNNMYFLQLNKEFKPESVFEVQKFRNKFPGKGATGAEIKAYGYFDFIDYQSLGDDEFLFFLNDNEKKSIDRKKSTLYGIISYTDGKFTRQTLNLKTETSTIYPLNAKKGYLLLVENFEEKGKATEFRLEKINY